MIRAVLQRMTFLELPKYSFFKKVNIIIDISLNGQLKCKKIEANQIEGV